MVHVDEIGWAGNHREDREEWALKEARSEQVESQGSGEV
jgi:hypothetical protein